MIAVADLIEWLEAEPSDAVMLASLEAAVVSHIQKRTGRYFGPEEDVTEILPGSGTGRLYLADMPVAVDGEIVVTAQYAALGDELADDADFVLRSSGTEAWLDRTDGGRWTTTNEYHIAYRRGYLPGAEPEDIRNAVVMMISETWNLRGREGLQSEDVGGYSYTLTSKITDRGFVSTIIDTWRRPVIA